MSELTAAQAAVVKNDPLRGNYTVEVARPPALLTENRIPDFFKDQLRKNQEATERALKLQPRQIQNLPENCSALYKLRMCDIVKTSPGRREPHPLHASETGQNFSIADDGSICHCWRHLVSLNQIQYLAVKSGYAECQDAGTPHKDEGASHIIGDGGAVFYAWRQAKIDGLIPVDDPIPAAAMRWLAKQHHLVPNNWEGELLPKKVYNKVLEIDLAGVKI